MHILIHVVGTLHIHTYTIKEHAHIHTYTHYTHSHACMQMHTQIHTITHTHYTHAHIHTTHIHTHTYAQTHTQRSTNAHANEHTQINKYHEIIFERQVLKLPRWLREFSAFAEELGLVPWTHIRYLSYNCLRRVNYLKQGASNKQFPTHILIKTPVRQENQHSKELGHSQPEISM